MAVEAIAKMSEPIKGKEQIARVAAISASDDEVGSLVARVKAHINRYDRLAGVSTANNDIVEIRDLKIDAGSRRVWGYGDEKTLTAKEFDILYFLAKHPNKVYSKEDLFKEVWGLESMGDISTVTVHIKNIREKIEQDSSKPQFIETIWGVGYRFRG